MTDAENQTPAAAAPQEPAAAAPAAESAAPGGPVPTPEMIAEAVKGNARVQNAAATFAFLSLQGQQMLTSISGGNIRLALAISSELKLFYEEVLRRQIKINENTPPSNDGQTAEEVAAKTAAALNAAAQDNQPEKTA